MMNKKFGFGLAGSLATIGVFVVFISIAYPAFAADVTVSRSMPDRVDPLGALTVSFSISPSKTLSSFDIAELMPQAWSIKDWSVSGFDKSSITLETQASQSFMGATYKGYDWKFNSPLSSAVTLTYTLDVPVSSGSYNFVGIWTYPGGFDKDEKTLSVAVAPPTTTTTTATTTTTIPGETTTTTAPSEEGGMPEAAMYIVIFAAIVVVMLLVLWKTKILKLPFKKKSLESLESLESLISPK